MRTWVYIVLAIVVAAGAAGPAAGSAAAVTPLPYNLVVTGDTFSGMRPSGAITGTMGGIAVDGRYAGGSWTLAVYGHSFATGTYACVRICRFNGTALAGRPMIYSWTSQIPTWDAQAQLTTGTIDGAFASRRDWPALVAAWARANGLPAALQTRLVVDAQAGM